MSNELFELLYQGTWHFLRVLDKYSSQFTAQHNQTTKHLLKLEQQLELAYTNKDEKALVYVAKQAELLGEQIRVFAEPI